MGHIKPKVISVKNMMQGFSSQLIPSEVGSDITSTNRPEIPELCILAVPLSYIALDQNFNNQSGINYVGLSVPSDLPLSGNWTRQ